MREGREGGVLGRTYCIPSQMMMMVCMVWTHVSDCHTAQHLLAAHSCGDGHSSPLINVVGGHSQMIVCGGWALVVVGPAPKGALGIHGCWWAFVAICGCWRGLIVIVCHLSWSSIGCGWTHRGRCSLSSWVVSRCQADPKRGHAEVTWGVLAVNPQWALKGGVVTLISWVMMEVVGVRTACLQYKMMMMKLLSLSVYIVSWPCHWLGAHGYVHDYGAAGHAGHRVHPLVAVGGFHGHWSLLGRGCVH